MKTNFLKYEAFVAGCFLASQIDGNYDDEEIGLIFEKIVLAGEGLSTKVDHDTFFAKWKEFQLEGGLERIEAEIIKSLKKCGEPFRIKVVAWMEKVTFAAMSPTENKWQDSKEKALIKRIMQALGLKAADVKKYSKSLQ